MNLKLIKASPAYQNQIVDMLQEWSTYNQQHPEADPSPTAIFRHDYHDFDSYLNNLETKENTPNRVANSVFFCLDTDRNIIVGAIDIRHQLNDYLAKYSGHLGDGIRPSERRKGYATQMIKLALEECRKLNLKRILMVCDKANIGSAKSIIKNGGILESEIIKDSRPKQRYWIDLD